MNSHNIIPTKEVGDSSQLNLYEKREPIFTRTVEGFYQKVRRFTGWPLLLGYFLVPWIEIGGRQAILFDLPARQFHIFWLTFWPQDFTLLAWGLMIAAFALFFFTNLAGRVWCGYTCPQTVWTAMFMWAEQITEGDRQQRINLQASPWSLDKFKKRLSKHFLWIGIALLTGTTFIAYFYGAKALVVDAILFELPLVAVFWVGFFTAATYINAGWMREQVCKYMCPYARFQSAMFDKDTLVVAYDAARGETRGARKRNVTPSEVGLGDCIDCTWCVQVCPTGIDIRDGLQYECINCAACVDACNSIMDKMGYERGLISYTTEHAEEGIPWTWRRPRLIGYGLMLLLLIGLFGYKITSREMVALDVLRDRSSLYQELVDGRIQNSYLLKAMNKTDSDQRYKIVVSGMQDIQWSPSQSFLVKPGTVEDIALSVSVPSAALSNWQAEVSVRLESANDASVGKDKEVPFLGPQKVTKDAQ